MKKLQSIFIAALMLMGTLAFAETIYDDLGNSSEALKKWSYGHKLNYLANGGPTEEDYAVKVSRGVYFFDIDTKLVAGKRIKYSAKIKTDNIAKPEKPYFGLKFMMIYTNKDNKKFYRETIKENERFGSMDWTDFEVIADIPADVKDIKICVGIQDTDGTAYFSDIDIEVVE